MPQTMLKNWICHAGLLLVAVAACSLLHWTRAMVANEDANDQAAIHEFIASRRPYDVMCLYAFDRIEQTQQQDLTVVPLPASLANDCPFGSLQMNPRLTTRLTQFYQGIRLQMSDQSAPIAAATANDLNGTVGVMDKGDKCEACLGQMQLGSMQLAAAATFYTHAIQSSRGVDDANPISNPQPHQIEHRHGISFELVLRRTAQRNGRMTLFSIGSDFDECTSPGFRVEINDKQEFMLIYYLLHEDQGFEICQEQVLVSSDSLGKCIWPAMQADIEKNSWIQLFVTLSPPQLLSGSYDTEFIVRLTDPMTLNQTFCGAFDTRKPVFAKGLPLFDKTIGMYRLLLGNNIHRRLTRTPKPPPRKKLGLAASRWAGRTIRPMTLRDKLWNILDRIHTPALPEEVNIAEAYRGVELNGMPFDLSLPFQWLGKQVDKLKNSFGPSLVDNLASLLQSVIDASSKYRGTVDKLLDGNPLRQKLAETEAKWHPRPLLSNDPSEFDLFLFVIYNRSLSRSEIFDLHEQKMLPLVGFPASNRRVQLHEDQHNAILDLTGPTFGNKSKRVALQKLPDTGRLLFFGNKSEVTESHLNRPLDQQESSRILFVPPENASNFHLPRSDHQVHFGALTPFCTVKTALWDDTHGNVSSLQVQSIRIFVNPVKGPPSLHAKEILKQVHWRELVLLQLDGDAHDDAGAAKRPKRALTNQTKWNPLNVLLNQRQDLDASKQKDKHESMQRIRINRLPAFGKLYDLRSLGLNGSTDPVLDLRDIVQDEFTLETKQQHWISPSRIANQAFLVSTLLAYELEDASQRFSCIIRGSEPQPTPLCVVDELWYQLTDDDAGRNISDPAAFSEVGKVLFYVDNAEDESGLPRKLTGVGTITLQEDSVKIISLIELEPLVGVLSAQTQYRILQRPESGALYQFVEGAAVERGGQVLNEERAVTHLGRQIVNDSIVDDPLARVVYVPNLDYFNSMQTDNTTLMWSIPLDRFSYELVLPEQTPDLSASVDAILPRVIQLKVMNVPDELTLLPPFRWNTTMERGAPIQTSIAFVDPDIWNDSVLFYRVHLDAEDGISAFELDPMLTDRDVLEQCVPHQRPCDVVIPSRQVNNEPVSYPPQQKAQTMSLTYHVDTSISNPSHLQFVGTRQAVTTALTTMVFRDWTWTTWWFAHQTQFSVTIERLDESLVPKSKAKAVYFIEYPEPPTSELSHLLNTTIRMTGFAWFFLFWWSVWFVVSTLGTNGWCCCPCCAKRRKAKRIEQRLRAQQRYVDQVVQSDDEYSSLLLSLADILLKPDLNVSVALFLACRTTTTWSSEPAKSTSQRPVEQMVCLKSLLGVLENERHGVHFVLRLLRKEHDDLQCSSIGHETQGSSRMHFLQFPSDAGFALGFYSYHIAKRWLRTVFSRMSALCSINDGPISRDFIDHLVQQLLEELEARLNVLPVEIVVLCRAFARLRVGTMRRWRGGDPGQDKSEALWATHLLFFNHLIGIALIHGDKQIFGFDPSRQQRQLLTHVAATFVQMARPWSHSNHHQEGFAVDQPDAKSLDIDAVEIPHLLDDRLQSRYERVLETILNSAQLPSAFVASPQNQMDADFLGISLMNVHVLLRAKVAENFYDQMSDLASNQLTLSEFASGVSEYAKTSVLLRHLLQALGLPLVQTTSGLVAFETRFLIEHDQLWWLSEGCSDLEWQQRVLTCEPMNATQVAMEAAAAQQLVDEQRQQKQQEEIEASTKALLVSEAMSVLCLRAEYAGNANGNFLFGIDTLHQHYETMRRVRGDGNCFFRAFIFALCEKIVWSHLKTRTPITTNPAFVTTTSLAEPPPQAAPLPTTMPTATVDTTLYTSVQDKIRKSKSELIALGYSEVAIDTFWETFVDYLASMPTRSHAELVQDFQTEGGEAEYLVWYMRLLTAGYLKKHAERFQPFIEGLYPNLTVEQFCAAEVEPMGKECEQPQIAALTEALGVGVKIEYLDGRTKANEPLQSYVCNVSESSSKQQVPIHLLYRPGHYDILYPRQAQ